MPRAKPRIKLHCAAILNRCTVPQAVLVATIRHGVEKTTFVLLDDDVRDALQRMRREVHPGAEVYCPITIRTHAFGASGEFHDDEPLSARRGSWCSGEPLWVDVHPFASRVLEDFDAWREANPPRDQAIWAPSWLVLVGCQSLAVAAGLPMPGPCGMGLDHPEVRA